MAKVHKTTLVAQGIYTESRLPSFWVFSAFCGKGTAKMPLYGYIDEESAIQHAKEVGGYYINMTIKAIK